MLPIVIPADNSIEMLLFILLFSISSSVLCSVISTPWTVKEELNESTVRWMSLKKWEKRESGREEKRERERERDR